MDAIAAASLAIDPQATGALRAGPGRDDPESLRRVAREFEALLLDQVLKSMRKASFGDEMFDSEATRAFTGMLDTQYAQTLARGRGLGLADLVVRQVALARGEEVPGFKKGETGTVKKG